MKNIDVSVTIITYNQEAYIRQCLDSVFMQKTNFNFEVIVAEDASPDNTRQILLEYKEKYGDKLVLVLHDENVGSTRNANSARAMCQGRYVAGMEGDDFWTDEFKLQKQYDLLENNPQYSAVGSDHMIVSSEGKMLKSSVLNLKKDTIYTMDKSLKDGFTVHGNTLLRRNIFPEKDPKYQKIRSVAPTMGDTITFTLLYDAGDIYVMKDVMLAHRMPGKNDSSSFSFTQKTKAIEYTYMFIDIQRALEEYLGYKYDLTPKITNRLSELKKYKLLRKASYDGKAMKEIMKMLPIKYRIDVYIRLAKKLFNGFKSKIRR